MAELTGHRLLLLQGPAGPFFARVARQLRTAGAEVTKVNFNGGEDLYYREPNVVRFAGARAEWPAFFERLARERRITGIVLFGDCRPLHRAAIERAHQLGIAVFVFEEGYVRPDYVTLERDGVNGHSALPGDPATYPYCGGAATKPQQAVRHAFMKSALHTICYAASAALLHQRYPLYRHHRDIRPVTQTGLWVKASVRRVANTLRDRLVAGRLERHEMPPYFFVPLQVSLDSQLEHSHYESIGAFIDEVLRSFAAYAPRDHALVLKLHPMDRPYSNYARQIRDLGRALGLSERLFYVDVINLPAALRGARGVVVINSTVGLSSLMHGTPVKCMGRAIYDLPGLTHQGSLESFFGAPTPVDRELCQRFRQHLLAENQLNGSVWSKLYDDPARIIARSSLRTAT